MQSGQKATAIVQDLLTLARRGAAVFDVVNLNKIVKDYLTSPEYIKMNSYHPDVVIVANLSDDLLNINGSAVHLSKSVMNLVSNAVEAMSGGGEIHLATENRYVDKRIRAHEDIIEGDYVVLTVSDEGLGIEPEDLDRIYEPFYTKKKMGHSGTGLGMSVVWGTVKDHNGFIDIKSTIGEGTTITVFLPATREKCPSTDNASDVRQLYGDKESLLVIDDVEAQREIASSILTQLNYTVHSAASGEEALQFLEANTEDL
jgi:two-component system cell cycle sensor histidine kinase/response regulator CckA